MAALGPELIPEGEVVVVEALPTLLALAGLLFAWGCVKLVDGFVRALFGTAEGAVGWIPFAGKVLKAPIHKIEQKLTNYLGRAAQGLDHYIGSSFHKLGRIVRHIGRELEGLAHDTWMVAKFLAQHPTWSELRHFAKALTHPLRVFQHLERRLMHLFDVRVQAIARSVAQGVYPRLRAEERTIERVLEPEFARLRERTRTLENEYAKLRKWTRAHARAVATAVFIGAVEIALRKLGGGWIRCKNWRRIGKHVCGLPVALIEDLLALTLDALILRDLCQMVGVIQGLARRVAPEINALVLEVEGFICGGKQSAPSGIVASDWQRVAALPSGIVASDLRGVTD